MQPLCSHKVVGRLGEAHSFAKQAGGQGQLVGLEYDCPKETLNTVGW